MKAIAAILLIFLNGCAYHTFQLSGGRVVECKFYAPEPCGYYLEKCKDGKKYFCQRQMEQIKDKGDARKKNIPHCPSVYTENATPLIKKI